MVKTSLRSVGKTTRALLFEFRNKLNTLSIVRIVLFIFVGFSSIRIVSLDARKLSFPFFFLVSLFDSFRFLTAKSSQTCFKAVLDGQLCLCVSSCRCVSTVREEISILFFPFRYPAGNE